MRVLTTFLVLFREVNYGRTMEVWFKTQNSGLEEEFLIEDIPFEWGIPHVGNRLHEGLGQLSTPEAVSDSDPAKEFVAVGSPVARTSHEFLDSAWPRNYILFN